MSSNKTIKISPGKQNIALAALVWFALSFILVPIWKLENDLVLRITFLSVSILAGLAWSWLAAGKTTFTFSERETLWLAITALLTTMFNLKAITSVIPWQGDEDFHIDSSLLFTQIYSHPTLLLFPFTVIMLFLIKRYRPKLLIPSVIVFLLLTCLETMIILPDGVTFARYPGVNRFFVMPGLYISSLLNVYPREWVFRLPILIATILMISYASRYFTKEQSVSRLLAIPLMFTIPVVSYYSSILYLELPMIFLMTVVCFNLKDLLTKPFEELSKDPAWYALILVGFLRESALPFLVAFMAVRSFILLSRASFRIERKLVLDSLRIGFVVLLPLVIQLAYGSHYEISRPYSPNVQNLFNSKIIGVVFLSYWESFGWLILPFFAGVLILLIEKRLAEFFLIILYLELNFIFWTMDDLAFWGHSRFNLMIIPVLLLGTSAFFRFISAKFKWVAAILALLVITGNLFMSPLQIDGTKKNNWGVYYTDAEYYYPYRDAISWLSETGKDCALIAGMEYDYDYRYYQNMFGNQIRFDFVRITNLPDALDETKLLAFDFLLYQVDIDGKNVPAELEPAPVKVFENKAGKLLIYQVSR